MSFFLKNGCLQGKAGKLLYSQSDRANLEYIREGGWEGRQWDWEGVAGGACGRQRCAGSDGEREPWIPGAFRTAAAAGLQLGTRVNVPLLSLHQSEHFVS